MREVMADVADNDIAPLEPVPVAEGVAEGEAATTEVTIPLGEEEGGTATMGEAVAEDEASGPPLEVDAMRTPELDGVLLTAPAALDPGGGTACEGFARAPTPQGIASPVPGCVALGAGVVAPDAVEMVNRVVHCLSLVWPLVNW